MAPPVSSAEQGARPFHDSGAQGLAVLAGVLAHVPAEHVGAPVLIAGDRLVNHRGEVLAVVEGRGWRAVVPWPGTVEFTWWASGVEVARERHHDVLVPEGGIPAPGPA